MHKQEFLITSKKRIKEYDDLIEEHTSKNILEDIDVDEKDLALKIIMDYDNKKTLISIGSKEEVKGDEYPLQENYVITYYFLFKHKYITLINPIPHLLSDKRFAIWYLNKKIRLPDTLLGKIYKIIPSSVRDHVSLAPKTVASKRKTADKILHEQKLFNALDNISLNIISKLKKGEELEYTEVIELYKLGQDISESPTKIFIWTIDKESKLGQHIKISSADKIPIKVFHIDKIDLQNNTVFLTPL